MKTDKIFLTKQQAKSLINKRSSQTHTFRSGSFALIGCDWSTKEILKAIDESPEKAIEIGGDACKRMGHGLVLWTGKEPLFIEVDKDKLQKLEDSLTK